MAHTAPALETQGLEIAPGPWTLDTAHSNAHFSVRHMMISNVRGEFTRITGDVSIDPRDLTRSFVNVAIDTASVNTREEQRDVHLRSADFFDAEKHPKITFRSKRIEAVGEREFRVIGDLTIRDVTREVAFAVDGPTPVVKDPWGNLRTGITATAKINRKDFGLTWNAFVEGGGVLVGEEVKIEFDAELVHPA